MKENNEQENNIEEKKEKPIVYWREEALKGNFMPAMIMLEQNKINEN